MFILLVHFYFGPVRLQIVTHYLAPVFIVHAKVQARGTVGPIGLKDVLHREINIGFNLEQIFQINLVVKEMRVVELLDLFINSARKSQA